MNTPTLFDPECVARVLSARVEAMHRRTSNVWVLQPKPHYVLHVESIMPQEPAHGGYQWDYLWWHVEGADWKTGRWRNSALAIAHVKP